MSVLCEARPRCGPQPGAGAGVSLVSPMDKVTRVCSHLKHVCNNNQDDLKLLNKIGDLEFIFCMF